MRAPSIERQNLTWSRALAVRKLAGMAAAYPRGTTVSLVARGSPARAPACGHRNTSCVVGRGSQLGDVQLGHLQHRLHGPARALRIGVGQQLAEDVRHDLPRQAVPVLEPTALAGLAAVGRERVPVVVDLRLILAVDNE